MTLSSTLFDRHSDRLVMLQVSDRLPVKTSAAPKVPVGRPPPNTTALAPAASVVPQVKVKRGPTVVPSPSASCTPPRSSTPALVLTSSTNSSSCTSTTPSLLASPVATAVSGSNSTSFMTSCPAVGAVAPATAAQPATALMFIEYAPVTPAAGLMRSSNANASTSERSLSGEVVTLAVAAVGKSPSIPVPSPSSSATPTSARLPAAPLNAAVTRVLGAWLTRYQRAAVAAVRVWVVSMNGSVVAAMGRSSVSVTSVCRPPAAPPADASSFCTAK